jgi:hypothetical protein
MPDGGSGIVRCEWCNEPIAEDDATKWIPHLGKIGVPAVTKPWHINCFIRSMIGGLNHLRGTCHCCGGTDPPDPPEMSLREAADAAVRHYREMGEGYSCR